MLDWLFGKAEPEPELSDEVAEGHYCIWCGAQHLVKRGERRFFDSRTGDIREWEPWQTGCPYGHRSRRPDSSGL